MPVQMSYSDRPRASVYDDINAYADLPWFEQLKDIRKRIEEGDKVMALFTATHLRLIAESMPHERLAEVTRYLCSLASEP
jgi:hypothetical protein